MVGIDQAPDFDHGGGGINAGKKLAMGAGNLLPAADNRVELRRSDLLRKRGANICLCLLNLLQDVRRLLVSVADGDGGSIAVGSCRSRNIHMRSNANRA